MALRIITGPKVRVSPDSGADTSFVTLDKIWLPESARSGDLLILSMLAAVVVAEPSVDPPIPAANTTDPRLTLLGGTPNGTLVAPRKDHEPADPAQRNLSVWVGRVGDEDIASTPLQVNLQAGTRGYWHQTAQAQVVLVRSDDAALVELDGRSRTSRVLNQLPDDEIANAPIPGLDTDWPDEQELGAAALLVISAWGYDSRGVGLGAYVPDGMFPPWSVVEPMSGVADVSLLVTDNTDAGGPQAIPEAGTPKFKPGLGYYAVVMGLRVASTPVTRQYPRDDGRGLSSAARLYPTPKSQRIVGGHL